ncbi:MAG: methyltransferase domain-containing protein [Anaerolineales bacterium]|jgi:ubiquinone/menaquinone biosynthesis C-methylase UbiE
MGSESTDKEYFEVDRGYRNYDHPVVQVFMNQRIDYVRSWLDLSQIGRALDVGCGNGFSTYFFAQRVPDTWAIDASAFMLSRHPLRNTGKVSQADALQLPFADESFDLVYSWELLHHVDEPHLALAEMARVSRRYVMAAEPNRDHPLLFIRSALEPSRRPVLRFSSRFLKNQFRAAGLTIEHAGRGGWIFPNATPMWLLAVLEKLPYRTFLGISNWVLGTKES